MSDHSQPLIWTAAKGSTLYDQNQRPYVDLCAGFGSLPFGHNCLVLQQYLHDQLGNGMSDLYASQAKVQLLQTLRSCLPDQLERIALAVTGSQAVEFALRTALLATGKQGIISLKNCYHGLDLGVLPLLSWQSYRQPFANWSAMPVTHLKINCDLDELERAVFAQQQTGTAAIIVEPIQGRGGGGVCQDYWLSAVQDYCQRRGILLIYDEVFCGLGRCGYMTKAATVPADIVCLGKALGGGMPISAMVGKEKWLRYWQQDEHVLLTGTFYGHALSCAVATHTLTRINPTQSLALATTLQNELASIASLDRVKEVRGAGLLVSIVLDVPQAGLRLASKLQELGIIAVPAGEHAEVLQLSPALNIETELLRKALQIIAAVLDE
ncbi:MAG: aminotransferase class III-fold pyridoxal phosphate-dependent enzyme [Pseudomonadota bacterium]|nr:aminotransferase class III-fold pyridoxal phosphate-dependent enzyme [Pseudomonadota bacterium]